jgi:hypothetical protein
MQLAILLFELILVPFNYFFSSCAFSHSASAIYIFFVNLPKIEVRYHYQGILGQDYSGFHSGITLPLWEKKNTVRWSKALSSHAELNLQSYQSELYTELKNMYDQCLNLQQTVTEYKKLLEQANQETLLTKAMTTGYINSIEYFMEISFYRNAKKRYLEMEAEYQKIIANLLRYRFQ